MVFQLFINFLKFYFICQAFNLYLGGCWVVFFSRIVSSSTEQEKFRTSGRSPWTLSFWTADSGAGAAWWQLAFHETGFQNPGNWHNSRGSSNGWEPCLLLVNLGSLQRGANSRIEPSNGIAENSCISAQVFGVRNNFHNWCDIGKILHKLFTGHFKMWNALVLKNPAK